MSERERLANWNESFGGTILLLRFRLLPETSAKPSEQSVGPAKLATQQNQAGNEKGPAGNYRQHPTGYSRREQKETANNPNRPLQTRLSRCILSSIGHPKRSRSSASPEV
jgi:hypothetical protein